MTFNETVELVMEKTKKMGPEWRKGKPPLGMYIEMK